MKGSPSCSINFNTSSQRHTLLRRGRPAEVLVTELTRLQRRLLKLLGLPSDNYGR